MDGIINGFRITTAGSTFTDVECENYNSIHAPEAKALVAKQVNTEVANGRYVITNKKPKIVSALGQLVNLMATYV